MSNLKNFIGIIEDKNFRIEEALVLSSEERSGSTWVMEVLSSDESIVVNWEPFHEKLGVVSKDFNFGIRPYLKESESSITIVNLIRQIFELKRSNLWTSSLV